MPKSLGKWSSCEARFAEGDAGGGSSTNVLEGAGTAPPGSSRRSPSPKRTFRGQAPSLLFAALLASGAARAQTAQDRAIAERLFVEGRALMQDKQYERACAKFDESFRRDPTAYGTLLNLALCHEQIGRYASAWSEFRIVAAESRGKREDRVKLAEEHASQLVKDLSYLRVTAPSGVTVKLDGAVLGQAAIDTEIPVDPGARTIEASAPGKKTWTTKAVMRASGDKQRVNVPALEDAPAAPPPSPVRVESGPDLTSVEAVAAARARRTVGWAVAGAGVAVIGVGGFFGIRAINRYADGKNACPNDVCANANALADARSMVDEAKTSARISNVMIGVGFASLVGGVLLVLTSAPPPSAAHKTVGLVGPGTIGGTW
jgi:hypothetical protein